MHWQARKKRAMGLQMTNLKTPISRVGTLKPRERVRRILMGEEEKIDRVDFKWAASWCLYLIQL